MLLVVVNSDLAMRTWPLDDKLIFGPDFVGETEEDVIPGPHIKQYFLLSLDGTLSRKKVKAEMRPVKPSPVRLGRWRRVSVCTEPVAKDLEWRKLDRPRSAEQIGQYYGYVWYRIEIASERAGRRRLFLPDCQDRAILYVNGRLIGIWGCGEGETREPIPAGFRTGANVLALLVDNLGRFNFGPRLGERKGLFGHVYDAKPIKILGNGELKKKLTVVATKFSATAMAKITAAGGSAEPA